ncbi:unnamed protein product, partial [Closterium sp. NIES-53]
VSFNPATGERLKSVAPPIYSIVNLEGVTWQQKARWEERHVERFTLDLSQISRPGPLPGAAGAGAGAGGGSGGGTSGGAGNGSAAGVKEAGDYSAPAAFDALNQVSGEIGDFGVKSQAEAAGDSSSSGSGSNSSGGGTTGGSNSGTSPSTGSSMPGYTISLLVLLSLTLLCLVSYLAYMGYSSWRRREEEGEGQQQLYGGSSGGDVYLAGFKGGEVGGEEYVRRYNGDGEWIGGGSWAGGFGLGSGFRSGFGFGGGGGGIGGDEELVLGEGKGDGSGRKGGDGGDGMVDASMDDVDTAAADEGHHKQFIMAALASVSAAALSSSFVQTSSLKSSVKPISVRSTRAVRIVAMAQPDLKKEIQEKIAAAQETCSDPNSTAECAAAWDEVEEISAAAADQALKQKAADYEDPLEKYCNENPSEDECRIYSD